MLMNHSVTWVLGGIGFGQYPGLSSHSPLEAVRLSVKQFEIDHFQMNVCYIGCRLCSRIVTLGWCVVPSYDVAACISPGFERNTGSGLSLVPRYDSGWKGGQLSFVSDTYSGQILLDTAQLN